MSPPRIIMLLVITISEVVDVVTIRGGCVNKRSCVDSWACALMTPLTSFFALGAVVTVWPLGANRLTAQHQLHTRKRRGCTVYTGPCTWEARPQTGELKSSFGTRALHLSGAARLAARAEPRHERHPPPATHARCPRSEVDRQRHEGFCRGAPHADADVFCAAVGDKGRVRPCGHGHAPHATLVARAADAPARSALPVATKPLEELARDVGSMRVQERLDPRLAHRRAPANQQRQTTGNVCRSDSNASAPPFLLTEPPSHGDAG